MKPETQSFYEQAVRRAIAHVVEHLDEALDLERLARHAALSPFHFHRIFRGMLGETPLELHRRLRLERAAWQLLNEDTSVTTVALAAGYDTHEAFTRSFRARHGYPPSELRKQRVEGTSCARPFQIEIAARSGVHFSLGMRPVGFAPLHGGRSMNVAIEKRPELRAAALRHTGPYHRISEAFARLGDLAGRAGLCDFGKPTMIAVYYDDPETTPEHELRSDAALVIPEDVRIPDGLTEVRLPAGRYAHATHVGPYTELGDAWARFMGQWLPESGERLGPGETYEIYVNTPMEAPPEKLQTELYLPLAS